MVMHAPAQEHTEDAAQLEAAELTGAPEATMRTRLFHARKKLRAALEKEGVR